TYRTNVLGMGYAFRHRFDRRAVVHRRTAAPPAGRHGPAARRRSAHAEWDSLRPPHRLPLARPAARVRSRDHLLAAAAALASRRRLASYLAGYPWEPRPDASAGVGRRAAGGGLRPRQESRAA